MTRVLALSPSPVVAVPVNHAMSELRCGGFVTIFPTVEGDEVLVVQAAEAVTSRSLGMLACHSDRPATLALTLRRALMLGLFKGTSDSGLRATDVVLVNAPAGLEAEMVLALAQPRTEHATFLPENFSLTLLPSDSTISAAVRLVKLARLLPAAVVAARSRGVTRGGELVAEKPGMEEITGVEKSSNIIVTVDDINTYDQHIIRTLRPVGEARVPLEGAESARLIAFRPGDGGIEHLAIIVGTPSNNTPVLVRLHSECFTGDLLGSLRCDCGSQLRGAIAAIAAAGAGILLYLAQEGRGIGLVNKLRAYQLQDYGFDTLDANGQLGFDDDERIYLPAVEMLRQLGFYQVRLMTNNPRKVEALIRHGIEVIERIPHIFPSNTHNASYIRTKATKGGHLF